MFHLWSKDKEKDFFIEGRSFSTDEQLFYVGDDGRYYAYWPKSYKGTKSTLQSRNALIGSFTERFTVTLLQDYANTLNMYAVQGVVCDELGLTKRSPADVAICKTKNIIQDASNINLIIEVKMSIVWNWELKDDSLICLGDYRTHQGNPGLLRSDSMLKAIGKSINVRVANYKSSKIPIIILGNTPITESYYSKVDHLKKAGIIQGFWSINPNPLDNNGENLKNTSSQGFLRIDSLNELKKNMDDTLRNDAEFFSSMKNKNDLGRIIEIANKELNYKAKAEKFLSLLRN